MTQSAASAPRSDSTLTLESVRGARELLRGIVPVSRMIAAESLSAASGASVAHDPKLIAPANDDLFSSGTLGRYSKALSSVMENKSANTEVVAD